MATLEATARIALRTIAMRLGDLDPPTRARVKEIYRELRGAYTLAPSARAREAAIERALTQLAEVPELRELVARARAADTSEVGELRLPESLSELEPRAAIRPGDGAPPGGATRGLGKKRAMPKPAKKNGGGAHAKPPVAGNGGGAARERAAVTTLTRYPEVTAPPRAAVGQKITVNVWLRVNAPEPGAEGVTVERGGPPVDVVLYAQHCAIAKRRKPLVVHETADSHVDFELTPESEGVVVVRADFYQSGRLLGTATAGMMVGAAVGAPPASETFPLGIRSGAISVADLNVIIRRDDRDAHVFHFELHSEIEAVGHSNDDKLGSMTLPVDPIDKFNATYAELTKYADDAPASQTQARKAKIDELGRKLWDELFSPEMKAAYWDWKDTVRSILITSDEPWIPWEMVKPHRLDAAGKQVDEPFLCEKFELGRWLRGWGGADGLSITGLQAVASRNTDLATVGAEVRAFRELVGEHPHLTVAPDIDRRAAALAALANDTFSILHVATHGDFDQAVPDNSSIELTDGKLCANDVAADFTHKPRPIVFINACHGGRIGYALTGLGGWADRLVAKCHVGAFVGAAWEVDDDLALRFAERFYEVLLGGQRSIADAFREAREAIRQNDPGNSTWLAYVLYADPAARARVA